MTRSATWLLPQDFPSRRGRGAAGDLRGDEAVEEVDVAGEDDGAGGGAGPGRARDQLGLLDADGFGVDRDVVVGLLVVAADGQGAEVAEAAGDHRHLRPGARRRVRARAGGEEGGGGGAGRGR